MLRSSLGALLLLAIIVVTPQRAAAGGTEFPADGTRNLGRGGAGMASADDPYVMVRNPAGLADLWDDQAMLGGHFLLADSCFQPTGAYGAGTVTGTDVVKVGDEVLLLRPPPGAKDLQGNPLVGFENEAYPEVCYEGPMPFLPHLALAMKPTGNLGVGLGFFPPDNAGLSQWGNPDGTVDTPNGLRPNPLRYYRSHLNTSYFSVLAAFGYRPVDWFRFGFGFQWQLAVFQARTWSTAFSGLTPRNDIQTEVFGRDLFIPGFTSSAQFKFGDFDVALGYRWSDAINAKAKLDITSGPWGTGERYPYLDANDMMQYFGSRIRSTTPNQPGEVDSGPIWVPQVSAAVRYASRLKPRIRKDEWDKAHASAGGVIEDSMQTERWNVEADFIYYFTSVFDVTQFTNADARLDLSSVNAMNGLESQPATVGDCIEPPPPLLPGQVCTKRLVKTDILGKNQITGRIGGEYNVMPGFFTVRAGASYETDGQNAENLNVQQYMYGRVGLHGGLTVRLAKKTDINLGFAHFIQKEINLQLNPISAGDYRVYYTDNPATPENEPAKYHFTPGLGVPMGAPGSESSAGFDGIAETEVGNAMQVEPGPYFVNAGSYYYHLSVLSIEFIQHF